MSEDMPEQFHTLNVLRLIARPFTNGGSTQFAPEPPPPSRVLAVCAPPVTARGAAEPDHTSPYLSLPLRSEEDARRELGR